MTEYIGIQYLRGVAALLVVVYHAMMMKAAAPYFSKPVGEFGVDIFFVISGFVMWVSLEGRARKPGEFIAARFARIAPLYWFFTLGVAGAAIALPSLFFQSRDMDVWFLVKSLFFIPALNPDVGDVTPFYTIGWTLVYEMFFYGVFACSLSIASKRIRCVALFASLISLVLAGKWISWDNPVWQTYTSPILLEFLAGVLIAVFRSEIGRIPVVAAGFLALAALFAMSMLEANQLTRAFIYGPLAAAVVVSVVALEAVIQERRLKLPYLLGEASYSLYLSHPITQRIWYVIFAFMFGGITTAALAYWYAVGAVLAGIVGGVACYYLVESPTSRLIKARGLSGSGSTASSRPSQA